MAAGQAGPLWPAAAHPLARRLHLAVAHAQGAGHALALATDALAEAVMEAGIMDLVFRNVVSERSWHKIVLRR